MSPLPQNMEAGTQPIDELLKKHELSPTMLVSASLQNLTHKEVGKARRGRRLTRRMQNKVLRALNSCVDAQYTRADLFNYDGH